MKTTHRRSWLAVAGLLLAFVAPVAVASESEPAEATACAAVDGGLLLGAQAEASYAFEGCWTFWAAGPCFDIYLDSSGGYWQCRLCGTTSNPGPSQCSRISIQTLNTGYWCS